MAHPSVSYGAVSKPDSGSDEPIAAKDKRLIQSLLWAFRPLINSRRAVPLSFVTTFLMVALEEGKGVNEYARALGIHRATMSRSLHAIGDRGRRGNSGLGWISFRAHPSDRFRCQIFLTAKGRSIAKQVLREIGDARRGDRD